MIETALKDLRSWVNDHHVDPIHRRAMKDILAFESKEDVTFIESRIVFHSNLNDESSESLFKIILEHPNPDDVKTLCSFFNGVSLSFILKATETFGGMLSSSKSSVSKSDN